MRHPSQPAGARGSLEISLSGERLEDKPTRPQNQQSPQPPQLGPVEAFDVREVFWNLAAAGVRLPAERNIILHDGGRP